MDEFASRMRETGGTGVGRAMGSVARTRRAGSTSWHGLLLAAGFAVGMMLGAGRGECLTAMGGDAANAVNPPHYADTVFEQITENQGLPSPVVTAFTQDDDGFIWMATQSGLGRWDGYRFKTYQAQLGVAGTLPDNLLQALYTDAQGTIWVGSNAGGLARYDRGHDNFVPFSSGTKDLSHVSVGQIIGDGARGLWVGTESGLYHVDPVSGNVTQVSITGANAGAAGGKAGAGAHAAGGSWSGVAMPDDQRIVSLFRNRDGRLWVGMVHGLFEFDPSTKVFAEVPVPHPAESSATVTALFGDSTGRVWVGTEHGVYAFERGTESLRAVDPQSGDVKLGGDSVTGFVEAMPGVVWASTSGQGILVVDTRTMSAHRILHDPGIPSSLAEDFVQGVYRDRAGTVWVATRRGASRADMTRSGIRTFFGSTKPGAGIADSDVFSILPAQDGTLWLGLGRLGIVRFDENGRKVGALEVNASQPKTALPKGVVQKMVEAPNGLVYLASQRGLYRVGANGQGLARVDTRGDVYAGVNTLLLDRQYGAEGTLWVGGTNGLWKLDLAHGGRGLMERVELHGELTDTRVMALLRGNNNDLWIATENGLNRVDLGTMGVERIPPDAANPTGLGAGLISALLMDRRGRMWISTFSGGIDVLEGRDKNGRPQFRRLLKGLPNTNVNMLVEALDGHIWASTDNGIVVVDPMTFAMRSYQAADGVAIPAYWTGSGAVTPKGSIIFGGLGGMTFIDPKALTTWTYRPPVVVTDVRVGGKPVPVSRLNDMTGSDPLLLEPGSDSLTLEFSALDYTVPALNQYAYKLEGFDPDWIPSDQNRRLASYSNLPPGDYTLLLRGTNRIGVWSETRVVQIRVLPAWYQTMWFRLGLVLLAALLLGGIFQVGTAYLRARQRELERQVALRTAELERMTVELQQSQQQLEQMAYSDSLTGLPNRRMFNEYFRRLLALKRRQRGSFVLLVLDMDEFKEINDTYGHDAGDELLKEVGTRLGRMVRESDCFARLGGDEFAMLLAESSDLPGIEHVCRLIEESFIEPVIFGSAVMQVRMSIGVAFYPDGGETQDSLFKSADLALYQVKRNGGNGWLVHGGVPDGSSTYSGEVALPFGTES